MLIYVVLRNPHGQPELEHASAQLQAVITACGHTPFIGWQEIIQRGLTDPVEFMPFVRHHIRCAGLLLVVDHPGLRGGWIETGIAYADGIPVWLAHRPGEHISSSARGCAQRILVFEHLEDLGKQLTAMLAA